MRCVPLILLVLSACSADDLSLIVDLRTDYLPGVEFTFVDVRLGDAPPTAVPVAEGQDFVTGRRLTEFDGLASGPLTLLVDLVDAAGTTVATRRVTVDLERTTAVTIVMTRACAAVACPGPMDPADADQCFGTLCVPDDCTPETPERCSSECAVDADCSGGSACTRSACAAGACLTSPDDTLCAAGETCDPTSGCTGTPPSCTRGTLESSVYLFCDLATNWPAALTFCEGSGASLVSIEDAAENSWVAMQAEALLSGSRAWLGLNDMATPGDYRWVADDSAMVFDGWEAGEPDGDGRCVQMSFDGGDWFDTACDDDEPFICESAAP